MRINTNLAALNAWRSLTFNNASMSRSLEKLSSGYRVNRAADDAAGLAVSEKMRAQVRGLTMAIRNAQDGVSLLQTAEGGAQKVQDLLQRMRELAVQASSGTLTDADRTLLNTEFGQLQGEIDRTARSSTFNKIQLLANDDTGTTVVANISIQIGANTTASDKITVDLTTDTLDADNLTVSSAGASSIDVTTAARASSAITAIDSALSTVNTVRARFGAYQNRMETAISTLTTQVENLTAAESRIRDVDMASEMATFTKFQILQQASTAMLAQANQSTQGILSLLR